jgi:hypothetical protein
MWSRWWSGAAAAVAWCGGGKLPDRIGERNPTAERDAGGNRERGSIQRKPLPLTSSTTEDQMSRNMGGMDRAIRAVVALGIIVLWLTGAITGGWAMALGVIAAVFIVTSTVGFCPLYMLMGVSTAGHARA